MEQIKDCSILNEINFNMDKQDLLTLRQSKLAVIFDRFILVV